MYQSFAKALAFIGNDTALDRIPTVKAATTIHWLRQQPTITLDLALQGKQAAIEQAQQLGIKASLVIVDASGTTIHMSHMDDAPRPSQAISLGKALTASGFGKSTSERTDRLLRCSPAVQRGLPLRPRMALFGGGEPFYAMEKS